MLNRIRNFVRHIFMSKEDREEQQRLAELRNTLDVLKNRTESDPKLEEMKRKILAD